MSDAIMKENAKNEREQTLVPKDTFIVKVLSSMEKVFPDQTPPEEGRCTQISALRGETISVQLAYYWSGERKKRGDIRFDIPDDIKEYVNVHVRSVHLVPCSYPCHPVTDAGYLTKKPGMYPDLLRELDPYGFPIIAGQWRSLWIDIECSDTAPAGNYELKASITWKDNPETVISETILKWEVIGITLPKITLPHTEWFHADCLANYYNVDVFSEEHWRIIENFVSHAVKRNCTMILTPIFTPPLDTAIGGERRTVQLIDIEVNHGVYSFNFDKLQRWVQMCLRCGVQYFEISHLFSQWGAVFAPKIVAKVDGKETHLFGWHTKATSTEYTEFLQKMLPELLGFLKEQGIDQQCYFHISDEPQLDQLESYRAAQNIVKDILKDYHIIDALSDYSFYKTGLVDEPICSSDHLEPFLEDRPGRLWTYYCTAQYLDVSNRFIVQPGCRTRILGLQLYKYKIDGFLQWGYNFYNSEHSLYPINPFECNDADGSFPSGDPFVVYPGKDGTVLDSMRMMYMKKAFDDMSALQLLESLTDRETALKCLEETKYGELTFKKYPMTTEYMERVRERINQEIKKEVEMRDRRRQTI